MVFQILIVFLNNVIEQTSGRNNFREPAYHRLDLGMTYHRQKEMGRGKLAIWGLQCLQSHKHLLY